MSVNKRLDIQTVVYSHRKISRFDNVKYKKQAVKG